MEFIQIPDNEAIKYDSRQLSDELALDEYGNLVALAADICECEMAAISVIRDKEITIKAIMGIDFPKIDRKTFFFPDEKKFKTSFFISDIHKDAIFHLHPFVINYPNIHFYANYPIISATGEILGHLFLFDTQSKNISAKQQSRLQKIVFQASALLQAEQKITELQEKEQAQTIFLQETKKQRDFFENILNLLPTNIVVFDTNYKYVFLNPQAMVNPELRKFIIGKDDFEYFTYRNRDLTEAIKRREKFEEARITKKEIRWEDNILDTEGNPVSYLRRLFPVFDKDGNFQQLIGYGMEITDRKRLEEEQNILVKQLSIQNTQLVDFCNIVSHNLRGPLVNIEMLAKFIEESKEEAERQNLLSRLNQVIANLYLTFNELVESIQVTQDFEITSENILLADCAERTIGALEVEIHKSQAQIRLNFDECPSIYFPPKYLFSIFHNLISNALKYQSPQRKPIIEINSYFDQNGDVMLSFKDNGLGIDLSKHKDNLFKIGKVFHRHPNAKGFGLYMTKIQIEAMNGKIWVESTPNIGSTFFILFHKQTP